MWSDLCDQHSYYTQDEWVFGYHRDKSGKVWRIRDMEDSHILNCIKIFEGQINAETFTYEATARGLIKP
jgi:hypothetical protein